MGHLLAWRLLAWITVTTLALTTFVATASIMTMGYLQALAQSSLMIHLKELGHSVLVALVGLLHTAPLMPSALLAA